MTHPLFSIAANKIYSGRGRAAVPQIHPICNPLSAWEGGGLQRPRSTPYVIHSVPGRGGGLQRPRSTPYVIHSVPGRGGGLQRPRSTPYVIHSVPGRGGGGGGRAAAPQIHPICNPLSAWEGGGGGGEGCSAPDPPHM